MGNSKEWLRAKRGIAFLKKLDTLGDVVQNALYVYEVGKATYSAVQKIKSGEGSILGQAMTASFSIVSKSPINIIGTAAAPVDFVLGTQATETMDRLQEAAFDPVARDKMVSKAVDDMEEEGSVHCAADPSSCGFRWYEKPVWIIGRGIGF